MNIRELMLEEIEQLESRLKTRKAALRELEKDQYAEPRRDNPETRFLGSRPLDAMRKILTPHGKPMRYAELREILKKGGLTIGKKRADSNINVSVKVNVKEGNLTRTGKGTRVGDDEMIGLPEWSQAKKK